MYNNSSSYTPKGRKILSGLGHLFSGLGHVYMLVLGFRPWRGGYSFCGCCPSCP